MDVIMSGTSSKLNWWLSFRFCFYSRSDFWWYCHVWLRTLGEVLKNSFFSLFWPLPPPHELQVPRLSWVHVPSAPLCPSLESPLLSSLLGRALLLSAALRDIGEPAEGRPQNASLRGPGLSLPADPAAAVFGQAQRPPANGTLPIC